MAEKGRFRDSSFILVVVFRALNHAYEALMTVLYSLLISERARRRASIHPRIIVVEYEYARDQ